jgi:hypothetical protein
LTLVFATLKEMRFASEPGTFISGMATAPWKALHPHLHATWPIAEKRKRRDQECLQRIQNCHHTACKEIVHSTLRSWQTSRNNVLTASGSTPMTRWMVQCHSLLLQDLLGSVWYVEIISVPNILISSTLHNAGKTEIFKNYYLHSKIKLPWLFEYRSKIKLPFCLTQYLFYGSRL